MQPYPSSNGASTGRFQAVKNGSSIPLLGTCDVSLAHAAGHCNVTQTGTADHPRQNPSAVNQTMQARRQDGKPPPAPPRVTHARGGAPAPPTRPARSRTTIGRHPSRPGRRTGPAQWARAGLGLSRVGHRGGVHARAPYPPQRTGARGGQSPTPIPRRDQNAGSITSSAHQSSSHILSTIWAYILSLRNVSVLRLDGGGAAIHTALQWLKDRCQSGRRRPVDVP